MNTTLQKIDQFIIKRTRREKFLIMGTLCCAFFTLSYQYIIPITSTLLKQQQQKRDNIANLLYKDIQYLQSITIQGDQNYYITFYTKQLQELKQQFESLQNKIAYLHMKLHELAPLLYNHKKWALFLNELTTKAQKNGVRLQFIHNRFLDVTKHFGHVLEITIICQGQYQNIIAFINAIEQSDLVVDIDQIHMQEKKPITAQLKISIWGIRY